MTNFSHLPFPFTAPRGTSSSSSSEGLFQHGSRFNWNWFCLWQGKVERINSSRCAESQISNSGPCLESNWKQAVIFYREPGVDETLAETTLHARIRKFPMQLDFYKCITWVSCHISHPSVNIFPGLSTYYRLAFPPVLRLFSTQTSVGMYCTFPFSGWGCNSCV